LVFFRAKTFSWLFKRLPLETMLFERTKNIMARIWEFQEAKKSRHNARSLRKSRYKSSKNPHVFVVQNGEESDVYEAYSPENVEKNLPLGTSLRCHSSLLACSTRIFSSVFASISIHFVHTILQCLTSTLLLFKL
jgi:hypothetical protein